MYLMRSVFSILFVLVFIQQPAFSAKPDRVGSGGGKKDSSDTSDICDESGNLRGWAKKNHTQDECSTPVQEPNEAPAIVITSPSYGYSAESGSVVVLSAVATDAEEGDLSQTVSWASSIDGAISQSVVLSEGQHVITASVTDSGGLASSDEIVISMTAPVVNAAPTATINYPLTGSTFEQGQVINLSGVAQDEEDGDLSSAVNWFSSLDGEITNTVVLSVGEHTLSMTVADKEGLIASDSVAVSILPMPINTAPSIRIVSPEPNITVEEGVSFLFEAVASDAEDGDLTGSIQWRSSIDGSIANLTTLSVGDHTITATVADSEGLIAHQEITVSVTEAVVIAKSMLISWDTPLYRADGSPLPIEDIAGYEVTLVGQQTGDTYQLDVADGYANSFETEPVMPDLYELTIRTYDASGLFSDASSPVLVQISP